MTAQDVAHRFLAIASGWLVSLPHDLKVLFEAKDDPNLDRRARELAAGAILYVLSTEGGGGGEPQFVAFADRAILLHAALRSIDEQGGEAAAAFHDRFAEIYGPLADELNVCAQAMGDTFTWIAGKVENLHKQGYKGKKVPLYLDDDEAIDELYSDGLGFATNYPIDEEKLGMRLKKADTLLEPLKRRTAEEKKRLA